MVKKLKVPAEVKSNIPVVGGVFSVEELPIQADRVNNLAQKELAAHKAGVTRRKAMEALAEGLVAMKVRATTQWDDGGEEPDTATRIKTAETILKMFGDMKEFQAALGGTTHNTVIYQWLNQAPARN